MSIDETLNWQATQYVLGELSAEDCEAFEQRLSYDPAACEAVATASRLVLTTQAALAETNAESIAVQNVSAVASRPSSESARRGWIAVGSSVVAAGLVWGLVSIQNTPPQSTSAAELVSLWRTGVVVGETDSDDADADLNDGSNDVAVPAWLLAAVSIERDSSEKIQEN